MATRVKTVQYIASTVITTLAAATLRTLTGATGLYIPEADSGTAFAWKSCTLEVVVADDAGTTTTLAPTLGIGFTGAAIDSVVLSNPLGNSGEVQSWTFTRDVTAYFTTNWITGSTSKAAWWVNTTSTGTATANHMAKLTLTYQYDNTKITHLKTIWIPIESIRSLLTTTYQTIGGATSTPANLLRTYLPETGITVRQSWLELWGNEGTASTGAFTMQVRIGGGTALNMWRSVATGPNSARWSQSAYDITTYTQLSATTALALEGIMVTTTSRMDNIGGLIGVTYEFNSTGSTTIYNSLRLGGIEQTGWMGGTTLADTDAWSRTIYVEEPSTITMKESAVCLQTTDTGGFTMTISVTGQTEQTNVFSTGTLQAGIYSAVHRVDSGGRAGNGMSLARGKNTYTLLMRSGTANSGWNVNAFLLLNYTSGKHADGVGAHTHSCHQIVLGNTQAAAVTTNTFTSAVITPTIPETNYYLIGMVLQSYYVTGIVASGGIAIQHELQAGEKGLGEGWENLYAGMYRIDTENQNGVLFAAARTNYQRWNGDPDPDRCNFKTGRKFRIDMTPGNYANLSYWYTYNSITYTVSGTCSGFGGDGSGIPVDIYRVNGTQEEHVLSLTTVAGGTFTGNFIDNTDTLYAAAREDDTHVGRSKNGNAT